MRPTFTILSLLTAFACNGGKTDPEDTGATDTEDTGTEDTADTEDTEDTSVEDPDTGVETPDFFGKGTS